MIPFLVAMVLLEGSAAHEDFKENKLEDARIMELTQRVEVIEDEGINDHFPQKRTAILEVEFKGGEMVVHQVDIPLGMPENPLSTNELIEKFKGLTSEIIGQEKALEIAKSILHSGQGTYACVIKDTFY